MASAKFVEEALSTDVDESAVNAIVGSLETQLVTTTPAVSTQQGPSATVTQNHMNSAIANGVTVSSQKHGVTNGGPGSMNILNFDTNKSNTTSSLQSSNVVHSSAVNTVVASLQGGVPASGYINRVTSSVNQSNLTNLSTPRESVKIVYPSGSQTINSSVAFQPGSLPNGNLGLSPLSSHTVLNAVTSSVQSVVSQTHSQGGSSVTKQIGSVIGVEHGKPQGTALVIKASGNPDVTQGTPLGAGVVSVPMTVNSSGTCVNTAVGTSTASGMSGVVTLTKPVTHSVGTSQTLVGNSPATILPTNVQIVNVNAVRPGAPGQQGQASMASRVVIGAPNMVPQVMGAPNMVCARPVQPGRHPVDTTKEKCRRFLANLLALSSRETKPVERNLRTLIQELIDTKVEPEEFCYRFEKLVNASPQPCLIGFLKKGLPPLRQSLVTKEFVIEGIRPPPYAVVFSMPNSATMVSQLQSDMLHSLSTSKPTVSDEELAKLYKFKEDFGQEG